MICFEISFLLGTGQNWKGTRDALLHSGGRGLLYEKKGDGNFSGEFFPKLGLVPGKFWQFPEGQY